MLQISKNKRILQFLITAAILYTVWLLVYYLIIKKYTTWDYTVNYSIVYLAEQFFHIFNVFTFIEVESDHVLLMLDGGNNRGIWVGDECNGFKLFSIFTIFILAFPGNIKAKIWFIPLGLLLIHLANVIRIMALVLINNYHHKYLDFNHLYTFTIFVYGIIFLLWYWWAKRYANIETKN
jgi:exosortase family protein XrtF